MSKRSSAHSYGERRKPKWNKEVIGKSSAPLICAMCKKSRNKFLKGTLICALCATKIQAKMPKSKKSEVTK